jgi:hypothetical protein
MTRVVGFDINATYLDEARRRFGARLNLELHCVDLSQDELNVAPVALVHSALFFEHAGLDRAFENALSLVDVAHFRSLMQNCRFEFLKEERLSLPTGKTLSHLRLGGVFCKLERVASPTPALHRKFLATLDVRPEDEDPSNTLLDGQSQLDWLKDIGFVDVDCQWKWRELALLVGTRA